MIACLLASFALLTTSHPEVIRSRATLAPASVVPSLEVPKGRVYDLNLTSDEEVVDVVIVDDQALLITDRRVLSLERRGRVTELYRSACPIADASAWSGRLALANDCGTEVFDVGSRRLEPVAGLGGATTEVGLDAHGTLWAVDERGRTYRLDPGDASARPAPQAGHPHDIAATPDGSTWFATSIGLIELRRPLDPSATGPGQAPAEYVGEDAAHWHLHEEEARRGFELADNYVDRFWGHGQDVLWVKLDEAITFVDLAHARAGHAHLPALGSVGARRNRVYDVRYFAEREHAVFATAMGVLALSRPELDQISAAGHASGGKEIFSGPLSRGLEIVALSQILNDEAPQPGTVRGLRPDSRGGAYLFTEAGYAYLRPREVRRLLPDAEDEPQPAHDHEAIEVTGSS